MRLTRALLKMAQYRKGNVSARSPQNLKKIPFNPILPMGLRDRVSGKVDSIDKVPCLHELSILFASLKDNEFDEKQCKKEIEALKKAHELAEIEKKEEKLKNTGMTVSTGRKLTSIQLNKYLKRFPGKATKY